MVPEAFRTPRLGPALPRAPRFLPISKDSANEDPPIVSALPSHIGLFAVGEHPPFIWRVAPVATGLGRTIESGMRFRRVTRVLTSWIAVLAVLMVALAPAISHALGSKNAATWIEVCSSSGAKLIQVGGGQGDQAPAPAQSHPFEHCPYCSLQTDAVALPATPLALPLPVLLGGKVPVASFASLRVSHTWEPAQSRAPPRFS